MATRKDLFQSYQFMMQRVVSGVVLRESDPPQSPLRRMGGAAFAGVMITVLSLVAAGVIGLISPGGNKSWRDGQAVIIDKSSGAQYVYLKDDAGTSRLHPVPNLASGALLVGTADTVDVAASSLAGEPRAAAIGIANAPEALPGPDALSSDPWTLCSLPGETSSGEEVPNTSLSIGRTYTEGQPVDDTALLVRDTENDTLYLVANGRRFAIPAEDPVLDGLGLRSQPQVRVGTAWVSAVPAGDDLAPTAVSGAGQPSKAVDGARVGQVRSVTAGGSTAYYLVQPNDLLPLTPVQAQVTVADPTLTAAYGGAAPSILELSPAAAAAAVKSPAKPTGPTDLPAALPPMMPVTSDASTVCATFASGSATPVVAVEARVEGAAVAPATASFTEGGTVLANRIQVDGGSGVLVKPMVSPTAPDAMLYLVTDHGIRYAVPDDAAREALGYGPATPVEMPASLIARVPEGPVLDTTAARQPL